MATYEQAMQALRAADEAGNVEDAKRLAEIAANLKATKVQTAQPRPDPVRGSEPLDYGNMMRSSLANVSDAIMSGIPIKALAVAGYEGLKNINQVIDRGGYRAGEAVTDLAAPHVPAPVAGAAGYLANAGVQALPALIGTIASKATLQPAMEKGGRALMHSALKPTAANRVSGKADEAIDTLLKNWANVTPGGAEKLTRMKYDLINKIEKTLDDLPGGTVIAKAHGTLQEIRRELQRLKLQVNPSDDIKSVLKVWDDFLASHPNVIPIKVANQIKQGTYKILGDKAYTNEINTAAKEAQMALARGLRKDIEEMVPQVGPMNKELGQILNALKQVEYRVPTAANRDIGGLIPLAENPLAAAGMQLDRSPLIKSWLAQLLSHGARPVATGVGAGAGAMYGLENAQ